VSFSYCGRLVARQKLLATSLCLNKRAPLGAGYSFAPGLLLAKSGSGGLYDNAEDGVLKNKMAYRLLKDTKGFYIQGKTSYTFPFKKIMLVIPFLPVLYPLLVSSSLI
jgi:hypothetical protein